MAVVRLVLVGVLVVVLLLVLSVCSLRVFQCVWVVLASVVVVVWSSKACRSQGVGGVVVSRVRASVVVCEGRRVERR